MRLLHVAFYFWTLGYWTQNVFCKRFLTTTVEYGGAEEVQFGQCFSVHCLISVFDPYRWTRDGVPLDPGSPGLRFRTDKTLYNQRKLTIEIENAQPHLVGEYRCISFNRQYHRTRIKGAVTKAPDTGDYILVVGSSLSLDCPLNTTNGTVKWFKNGRELDPSYRFEMEGLSLHMKDSGVSDAGEYLCWNEDSANGHLVFVTHRPWVEPWESSFLVIPEGGNITLYCKVFGFPTPRVTWFVGNVLLSYVRHGPGLVAHNPVGNGHSGEHMLYLSDAAKTDENLYTCRAENAFGTEEISIYLQIRENGVVTNVDESERQLWVILGRPFFLQCNSTHNDNIEVTWLKNDFPVSSDTTLEMSGISIFPTNNSLLVPEATESDMGEYLCILRRPGSIDSARIFVQARILSVSGNSEAGNLVILKPGNNLILFCNSTHQNWSLIWYKDGALLLQNESFQDSRHSLTVINATERAAGDYMCVVNADQVQRLINDTISVRVVPEIRPFPRSETAKESYRWQLLCQVLAGFPEPRILWYKDGVQIFHKPSGEGRIHVREEGRTSFLMWDYLEASDRGSYSCLASNGVGSPANSTMLLRIRSHWAALWPFLGICCEVLILALTICLSAKTTPSPDVT